MADQAGRNYGPKAKQIIIDGTFGVGILWLAYTYFMYRFKVSVFMDNERLTSDQFPGSLINMAILAVVGYVAKSVGGPTAQLVEQTLRLIASAIAARYSVQLDLPIPIQSNNQNATTSSTTAFSGVGQRLVPIDVCALSDNAEEEIGEVFASDCITMDLEHELGTDEKSQINPIVPNPMNEVDGELAMGTELANEPIPMPIKSPRIRSEPYSTRSTTAGRARKSRI